VCLCQNVYLRKNETHASNSLHTNLKFLLILSAFFPPWRLPLVSGGRRQLQIIYAPKGIWEKGLLCYRIVLSGDRYFDISTHIGSSKKIFFNISSWRILTKNNLKAFLWFWLSIKAEAGSCHINPTNRLLITNCHHSV